MQVRRARGPLLVTGAVLLVLWGLHAAVTADSGGHLPEAARERFGASATTVLSRFHAQLTAPFFHETPGHLAYNSLLLAVALPIAIHRLGPARALPAAYLASPAAGVLVDVLVILPLAALGVPVAQEAAPRRLVGASVVAFSAIGMTLATGLRRGRFAGALAGVAAYELALAALGVTQPFVFAYHLTGLALGVLAARALRRRAQARDSAVPARKAS